MDFFAFHIKYKIIFFYIIILIIRCHFTYAGTIIDDNGSMMYVNDYGDIAKDCWVWIDTNNDSIAECFRFDKDGYIAKNYKDKYGKETNDRGQLIENNEVIKKMLSNGEIINKKQRPTNGILDYIGNVINTTAKTFTKKDKWTGKEQEIKEHETNGIEETIDGQVLYKKVDEEDIDIDILNGETAESGIIYSSSKKAEIADNVKEDKEIVAGKDFRRFITSKNKCTEKVNSVYIYDGDIWNDVLVLNGNGASVKFTIKDNNYIRFEVSHQTHGEETRDTTMSLDMYVDNEIVTSFDGFIDDKPEIVEEYVEDAKTVELKLNISKGALGRKVYIRNGRLKKVKIND